MVMIEPLNYGDEIMAKGFERTISQVEGVRTQSTKVFYASDHDYRLAKD